MIKPDPAELQREIEFSLPIQIKFSDIDGYLHVNNGVYFNYFEHARAMFLYQVCDWNIMEIGSVVGRIEMDYFRPIHIDDKVNALVKCSRIGNTSFDLEQYLVGETKDGESYTFAKSICILVSVDMKTMKPMPLPENYRAKLQPKS
ncbi:acyl-CoA thioesterase [Algoriphagus aquimarinus]|uniref:Acyl-CoA thioester hydrolase n=1 Tax=Algoriphagus aquimarinus TaxID=237018 RepID=A0A1I1BXG7_9BACT|nr:thioesterase family protein [Algoriphagus aquimarinus]SFB55099.1 acyl-CoA thioester hydrolase [Algoriphagus aquimarinus]|tara:strand:- start:48109 stop:48546 length:438 start_codon:yes stop_codon:yes gene_type:complete